MTRAEVNRIMEVIIPELHKLIDLDDATKLEISNLLYMQSGIKDYNELRLILKIIEELVKDDKVKINLPNFEYITELDNLSSIDSMIEDKCLNWYNVHSCLDSIAGGKIPVLVGLAGAGKTYTANLMSEIVFKFKQDLGFNFDKIIKVVISCSSMSHNDFWGSFDAVSHSCIGKFKYVWEEASINKDTLYYIIMDEILDIYDFRKTFGESFTKISELPSNIVIVGTGNKDVYDLSNETYTSALKDSGVVGRFDFITVNNVLEHYDSIEFNKFFDTIKANSSLEVKLKNLVLKYASKYSSTKMLIPRNVVKFISRGTQSISDSDYLDLLKNYIKNDSDYMIKLLFTDKPNNLNNKVFDELEVLWYDSEQSTD